MGGIRIRCAARPSGRSMTLSKPPKEPTRAQHHHSSPQRRSRDRADARAPFSRMRWKISRSWSSSNASSRTATADIARDSVDPGIHVLETETPGKCNALNLGERNPQLLSRECSLTPISNCFRDRSRHSWNASGPDRPIVSPSPSFRSLRSDPRDATLLSRAAIQPILRPAGRRTAAVASYSAKMLGRDGRPSRRSSLTTASSKGNSSRMSAPPSPAPKRSSNRHATSGR